MTDKTHEITPPPELVQQWRNAAPPLGLNRESWIATQAARWGADQELAACCSLALTDPCCGTKFQRSNLVKNIRNRRRPKPPSLKEQAHAALGRFFSNAHTQASQMTQDFEVIRRAVEQLPND